MSLADELFKAGDLAGTRAALIEQVRANPSDEWVRMFLFQLLALLGEWAKAKAQLETLAKLAPEARMLAVAYSQCMDAELSRAEIAAGAQPVSFHVDLEWTAGLGEAIRLAAIGQTAEAGTLRDAAFEASPASAGNIDGQDFDWIADADSRFGPTIEAMIGGRYGLMPFAALETLTISPPQDLRDTIWAQAQFALRDGPTFAGFIPVRYAGSETSDNVDIVRGQTSEFSDGSLGEIGLGHRLLVTSAGEDIPLLNARLISFRQT